MSEVKAVSFPEVAFPKDFRKCVMFGKNRYKKYDLNYLMKHGFCIIYTTLNSNDEISGELISTFKRIFQESSGRILIADMGNKGPIEYFNDIIFSWYELIRGTKMMSIFPLEILLFVTSISHLFSDDEEVGHIYMNSCTITTDAGRTDLIMISNKKGFVNEPLSNTIIDAHLSNLRERMEKEMKQDETTKDNKGIIIQGNSNILSNVSVSNVNPFQIIYNIVESKDIQKKKETIEAIKDIEKKGRKSNKFQFLKENIPWIIPLIDSILKIKEALG